ncbi:MAG TPA: PocR ligand-binding domain-containing protein [Anaeromyxobacteraceae bacterium]|nr:PocR ligand-binding domain-containing protein [Anaeromyxobacteraceae bacterium]
MDYRIQDLIDIPLFQVLQDRLNEIYSFPSAIIDNDGNVLTATAWQDVCVKFHRRHPACAEACRESDRYILSHLAEAKPAVTYRCPHGLVDNATPIVIRGKHLANYFTGQFFLAPPDLDYFRAQARRYGFDEAAYLEAVARVPIWTQEKLSQYLDFIKGFTEILCGIGLKHLEELEARRSLAESRTALEEVRAQLASAQRLEAVGRLAGGIAHDFNNMLSVIFANVDVALDELDPSSPLRAGLLEVREVATRSANLTRQLLAFARRQPSRPRTIDLNAAVDATLPILRRLLAEDVALEWSPSPEPALVSIDPSQLDQILANLCVNARDAIAGAGRVALATKNLALTGGASALGVPPGDYAVLTVADDGCGMAKELQDRIFEPFFSTKGGRGTGLGLATVYGIVTQHGGFVRLESAPGKGATFTLFFPRREPAAHPDSAEEPAAAAPSAGGAETVLLVEDEPAVRNATRRILERCGYVVLAAGTPSEAVRIAGSHRGEIHLLLSDVVMPEMDGVTLGAELRQAHPAMRQLFMSGYPSPLTSASGTLEIGVDLLPKPFSPAQLAERVRSALGRGGAPKPPAPG